MQNLFDDKCYAHVGGHAENFSPPTLNKALSNFIKFEDGEFSYKFLKSKESEFDNISINTYLLTSQKWPISEYSDIQNTIWSHELIIYLPHNVKYNQALLYVTAGYNKDEKGNINFLEPKENIDFAKIAFKNKAPVIELRDVPNQYLLVGGKFRKEDQILAYTYNKVMESPLQNAYLAGHLPMVKSVIKAMDAIQEILIKENDITIDSFVLSGASKRGWAIWLAALEDSRISAISPIVIDILNVQKSINHICQSYKNGCPPALRDYKSEGVTDRINSKEFADLMKIEDPMSYLNDDYDPKYKERMKLPKYIINASGDDFFVPDSSKFYFENLPGDNNYIRYLPNALHYFSGNAISDATENRLKISEGVNSFFYLILNNVTLPKAEFKFYKNKININSSHKPHIVKFWNAVNEEERDFRFLSSYDKWHLLVKKIASYFSKNLCDNCYIEQKVEFFCEQGYRCQIEMPLLRVQKGWQASFVEIEYLINDISFIITSEVQISPDIY
ncbi:MAG: PhoPQ-activated pathogenicity-related family protein [Rickettsiales bacterium]|nr:PhoPQ-activated pathogenicity-related family protein [Burkholderiales bacterium]MBY0580627.1 PhoPQ-activated pathogenicity-related family protein [Rickettsiales bacterium]